MVALALGLFARLFQAELQIPMDDEWHAIAKAATASPREIVLSFGLADHSIPVALYYDALIDAGKLSEAWMYAVPLAAGIAMAVLLVATMRTAVTPLALGLYAGLLAVSPLLVLYARQARPYALSVALALAAAWAAYRWWQAGRLRHAALYLACAPLAIWLHLIVAPFVLGVWIVLFAEWLASPRRDAQRLLAMVILGGTAVLLTAALVGPPLWNDLANLRAKALAGLPHAAHGGAHGRALRRDRLGDPGAGHGDARRARPRRPGATGAAGHALRRGPRPAAGGHGPREPRLPAALPDRARALPAGLPALPPAGGRGGGGRTSRSAGPARARAALDRGCRVRSRRW